MLANCDNTSGTVSHFTFSEAYSSNTITLTRKIVLATGSIAAVKSLPRRIERFSETSPMTIADAYLGQVRSVAEDWDGEGAPAPSKTAIENARRVLVTTLGNAMTPAYVEADVLGGVAIGFDSASVVGDRPKRSAWIACMNNGSVSMVLRDRADGNKSRGETFAPEAAGSLADFINFVK